MDLWQIPVIDQHAHNVLKPDVAAETPYSSAFTEGCDSQTIHHHARHSLCYRRSLRDMADLLECAPSEEAILTCRTELGWDALTARCFAASNLAGLILDDGFLPDTVLPVEWHQQFVSTTRLLRLEYLAEHLIYESSRFDVFLEWFRSELDPPPKGVVGFKSIAAYRVGLDVQLISTELAEESFYALKLQQERQETPIRLNDKALIDFLLLHALDIAATYQLPIQFHTGFGDPDLDLRLANPLHLRLLLEIPEYRQVPIVLLHAAYPFTREAAYLASVYPNVYVDFGLAIPFLSVVGMRQAISMLLELSPTSKIMYSSDAHMIPDLFYLGAKWGRTALGQVLDQAIGDRDLTAQEADDVAIAILQQNARHLYRLGASGDR
ncbi:MAG: amidohydrolase family protein [Elainellaceae cyanobacterium]